MPFLLLLMNRNRKKNDDEDYEPVILNARSITEWIVMSVLAIGVIFSAPFIAWYYTMILFISYFVLLIYYILKTI